MFSKILAALAFTATTANAAGGASYIKGSSSDVNAAWLKAKPIDYALCEDTNNSEQSPIDLTGGAPGSWDMDLELSLKTYTNEQSTTFTKNSNVQGTITGGEMELTFNGGAHEEFTVLQTHVHGPSEHTIDGNFMDLEMHFVHKYSEDADNGATRLGAVLGVLFDRNAGGDIDNDFIEQFIQFGGLQNSQRTSGPLFARNFLESLDTSEFWSYQGSLTTPPCTEGIKWTVLKEVQHISTRQMTYFNDLWMNNQAFTDVGGMGNNRPVQPLNQRTLFYREKPFYEDKEYFYATIVLAVLLGVTLVVFTVSCVCQLACGKCQKNKDTDDHDRN